MGTIPLPLPWMDVHRAGHPPALSYERDPKDCPFCRATEVPQSSPPVAEPDEFGHGLGEIDGSD